MSHIAFDKCLTALLSVSEVSFEQSVEKNKITHEMANPKYADLPGIVRIYSILKIFYFLM